MNVHLIIKSQYQSRDVMENSSRPHAIQLQPFVYQVGGHNGLLSYDKFHLCKSLIPNEHEYYRNMSSDMKRFAPEYKGLVEVVLQEERGGYMNLVAHHIDEDDYRGDQEKCANTLMQPKLENRQEADNLSTDKHNKRFRMKRTGSFEDTSPNSTTFELIIPEEKVHQKADTNPWSIYCFKHHIEKLTKSKIEGRAHKYIVLENVVAQYKYPCVLDLKMGTRDSWKLKSQQTTSVSLGVRVAGLQVYQVNSNKFLCCEKNRGRCLTVDGFHRILQQYLHNGLELRKDLLEPFIRQLEQIYNFVSAKDAYRWFGSSLLLMYEGDSCSLETSTSGLSTTRCSQQWNGDHSKQSYSGNTHSYKDPNVDIRIIDFSCATYQGFCGDPNIYNGPDESFLLGLTTVINKFKDMKHLE